MITDTVPTFMDDHIQLDWHGLDGVANDEWEMLNQPQYAANNLVDKLPSRPWRSQTTSAQAIIIDSEDSNRERFFVDTFFLVETNFRIAFIQAKEDIESSWDSPDFAIEVDNLYDSGDVHEATTAWVIVSERYDVNELADKLIVLRLSSGTNNTSKTLKIIRNDGNRIYFETTDDSSDYITDTIIPNIAIAEYEILNTRFVHRTGVPVSFQYWRIYIPNRFLESTYRQNIPTGSRYQIGEFDAGLAIELPEDDGFGEVVVVTNNVGTAKITSRKGRSQILQTALPSRVFDLSIPIAEAEVDAQVQSLVAATRRRNNVWIVYDYNNAPLDFAQCKLGDEINVEGLAPGVQNITFTLEEVR